jgi:hypothetical protein
MCSAVSNRNKIRYDIEYSCSVYLLHCIKSNYDPKNFITDICVYKPSIFVSDNVAVKWVCEG